MDTMSGYVIICLSVLGFVLSNIIPYEGGGMNFDSVPVDIPSNVTNAYLSDNRISVIRPEDFTSKNLKTIQLSTNGLHTIMRGSFKGTRIQELWLDENILNHFPDLREVAGTLRQLELGENFIRYVTENDVNYFLVLDEVNLENNPLWVVADMGVVTPSLSSITLI
jgi:Leucine-rich repeat (LRR) protein